MATRTRQRITKGVYRDKFGVSIIVSVKGVPREFRKDKDGVSYPTDKPITWYTQERIRVQAREQLVDDIAVEASELFSADVARFLKTISSAGHRRNTQGYMAHWEKHFAARKRNEITDVEAQTAYALIDKADSSRIHIRRALIQFYETLNGKSGYNPGRSLKKPPKPEEPIRDLPWKDIETMFAALQPSKAKARLMLIAYVGLPQKQIKALKPTHLRLDRRELVVHPRRKGAGVKGIVQPLSDLGVAALEEFARVKAFGSFQNQQLVDAFRSAAKRAGVTFPDDAVPYDLRHSFLTELGRADADIEEIARLGMHATIQQAARYIKGAAFERATNAIQSVPRFSATTKPRKRPKQSSSVHQRTTARSAKLRKSRRKATQKSGIK